MSQHILFIIISSILRIPHGVVRDKLNALIVLPIHNDKRELGRLFTRVFGLFGPNIIITGLKLHSITITISHPIKTKTN